MTKNIDEVLENISFYLDTDKSFGKVSKSPIKQALYSDILELIDGKAHVPTIRFIEKQEELDPNEQLVKIYDKLLAISYDTSNLDYRLRKYFNL